jgi:hypothetical protein
VTGTFWAETTAAKANSARATRQIERAISLENRLEVGFLVDTGRKWTTNVKQGASKWHHSGRVPVGRTPRPMSRASFVCKAFTFLIDTDVEKIYLDQLVVLRYMPLRYMPPNEKCTRHNKRCRSIT